MAGTQGSSYSSSSKAAAGNKATTQNLQKGLNASGSAKTSSGLGNRPASSSVNAAAANAARMAASRAATAASSQRTATSNGGGISTRTMAANYGAYKNPSATRMDSYNANARDGSGGVPAQEAITKGKSGISASLNPQESSFQGKGGFNPPSTGIAASLNNSVNSVLSRIGQMASTPFGTAPSPIAKASPFSTGYNLTPADIIGGAYTQNVAGPGGFMMKQGFGQPQPGVNEVTLAQLAAGGMDPLGSLRMLTSQPKQITSRIKDQSRVPSVDSPAMTAAAGYRGYDPISSISTPQTAAAQVTGYQNPARAFPTQTPQGVSPQNYNWNGSPNYAAANAAGMNQAFNVNSMPKVAMEGGIPGGISPDSVPSLPNYASPVSIAAREPQGYSRPTQTFAQNLVSRGFTGGTAPQPAQTAMTSPMAGQGASFRSPASAAQYNTAMGGLLGGGTQVAPASPASSNDPLEHPLYSGDSTPQQYVNGLLGGSGYNDLYGRQGMTNSNARDELNNLPPKERKRVVTEAGKASKDPEFRALSDADKSKVLELIKTGMTLKDALKAIKTPATGGGTQTASKPVYYPQYYSTWAGLPSGQRYA